MAACRELMLAEFGDVATQQRDLLRSEPRVLPSAFLRLNELEQYRFVELSACLGAAGAIGQRRVTILSEVSNAEMQTTTATNDPDWSAQ